MTAIAGTIRRRFFWTVGLPAHHACKPCAWEMEFRFVPDEIAQRFAFASHVAAGIDPRISGRNSRASDPGMTVRIQGRTGRLVPVQQERSEEHTSELQSHSNISY